MTTLEAKLQALVAELRKLRQGWDDLADAMDGHHSFDFRCGLQQCEAELGLFIPKLEALLAERQEPPVKEGRNWKGVRWIDSIHAANLAAEIALHFAHDCEDSMCGEDADASNCETAWIEDKLTDFLDSRAAAPSSGTGEKK